jgi:hypothetical protein
MVTYPFAEPIRGSRCLVRNRLKFAHSLSFARVSEVRSEEMCRHPSLRDMSISGTQVRQSRKRLSGASLLARDNETQLARS